MDWTKISQDLLEKIRTIKDNNIGWKVAKETKDVTCSWKQSSNFKGVIYKTEGEIDCDPDTVFHFINPLLPDAPRNRWDANIKERRVLETLSPIMSIMKTVTNSALAGLISPRVFIDIIVIDVTEDYLSTNAYSVEYTSSPKSELSGVRGTIHPSTIVCNRMPDNQNKTRLVTYIQMDCGGMLPQTLVDRALPASQMQFFAGLKKELRDAGH